MINLTELLQNPSRATELPVAVRKHMKRQLAALILALELAEEDLPEMSDHWLNVKEAAERLRISYHTLYKRVRTGEPPPYARRQGGRWIFSERGIERLGGVK